MKRIDYHEMMMSRRVATAVVILLALTALTGCDASPTFRPTITGRIVNAMQPTSGLDGVVVTVQGIHAEAADRNAKRYAPVRPGEIEFVIPAIQVSTVSDFDGAFSIPGEHHGPGLVGMISPVDAYRVRFHRDDFRDAIFDFYFWGDKPSPFIEEKQLGLIQLQPIPPCPPSTRPEAPVDVISR